MMNELLFAFPREALSWRAIKALLEHHGRVSRIVSSNNDEAPSASSSHPEHHASSSLRLGTAIYPSSVSSFLTSRTLDKIRILGDATTTPEGSEWPRRLKEGKVIVVEFPPSVAHGREEREAAALAEINSEIRLVWDAPLVTVVNSYEDLLQFDQYEDGSPPWVDYDEEDDGVFVGDDEESESSENATKKRRRRMTGRESVTTTDDDETEDETSDEMSDDDHDDDDEDVLREGNPDSYNPSRSRGKMHHPVNRGVSGGTTATNDGVVVLPREETAPTFPSHLVAGMAPASSRVPPGKASSRHDDNHLNGDEGSTRRGRQDPHVIPRENGKKERYDDDDDDDDDDVKIELPSPLKRGIEMKKRKIHRLINDDEDEDERITASSFSSASSDDDAVEEKGGGNRARRKNPSLSRAKDAVVSHVGNKSDDTNVTREEAITTVASSSLSSSNHERGESLEKPQQLGNAQKMTNSNKKRMREEEQVAKTTVVDDEPGGRKQTKNSTTEAKTEKKKNKRIEEEEDGEDEMVLDDGKAKKTMTMKLKDAAKTGAASMDSTRKEDGNRRASSKTQTEKKNNADEERLKKATQKKAKKSEHKETTNVASEKAQKTKEDKKSSLPGITQSTLVEAAASGSSSTPGESVSDSSTQEQQVTAVEVSTTTNTASSLAGPIIKSILKKPGGGGAGEGGSLVPVPSVPKTLKFAPSPPTKKQSSSSSSSSSTGAATSTRQAPVSAKPFGCSRCLMPFATKAELDYHRTSGNIHIDSARFASVITRRIPLENGDDVYLEVRALLSELGDSIETESGISIFLRYGARPSAEPSYVLIVAASTDQAVAGETALREILSTIPGALLK